MADNRLPVPPDSDVRPQDVPTGTPETPDVEAALRQSEETLAFALDIAGLGQWSVDLERNTFSRSRLHDQLFGYEASPPTWSYAHLLDHVLPEDRARVEAARRRSLALGRDWDVECRIRRVDGVVRWVHSRGRVWLDADGTPSRMVGTVADVTARREAEGELRQREERYRTLFESIDVGFCIVELIDDADGPADYRFLETNPAFVAQSGLDAVGRTLTEVAPDGSRERARTYAAIAATGEAARFVRTVGETGRWYEVYAVRVGGAGSRRVAVLSTDITDRRAAEWSVAESEERFRTTFENAAVGIAHVGLDGAWLRVNRRLCEIVGYARGELLTRTFQAITHPADLDADLALFAQLQAGTIPSYQIEKRYVHRDGHLVWITLTVSPARAPDGTLSHVISVVEDISARKAVEAALVAVNDQLEERVALRTAELARSNADLDQFAYTASHDLKAPLRAIDSLATWIEEDAGHVLPEASAGHLALLRSRAERMERLLDSLLTYSRVGRDETAPVPVDSAALVREAIALMEPPEGFDVVLAGGFPTLVTAPSPLALVFRNLIGNAIKHHDRTDGRVTITAETEGEWAAFTVADDGPGIPPAYHARVFGLFQTLRPRDEVEGSGMGLAILQKTVESHGGRVRLDSDGRGATFRFTWPLQSRA